MGEKDYRDVLKALEPISATSDPAKLSKIYGSRFAKAWELLKARAVKKYVFNPSGRVIWIVVGKEREYIIYPAVSFCSCDDFFFAVMDGKALACQHLIAQKLAEELSDYEVIETEDRFFAWLIVPNQEIRCKRSQNVVLTRKETLKLVNSQGGATSEASESSSHKSKCPSPRVVRKAVLELLPRPMEVFQS